MFMKRESKSLPLTVAGAMLWVRLMAGPTAIPELTDRGAIMRARSPIIGMTTSTIRGVLGSAPADCIGF